MLVEFIRRMAGQAVGDLWTRRALLRPGELRRLLREERARAERSNVRFAVLVLEQSGDGASRGWFRRLGATAARRIRATDHIGWFSRTAIVVLLPDTPICGAERVAEDVGRMLGDDGAALSWRAYDYPPEHAVERARASTGGRDHGADRRDHDDRGGPGVGSWRPEHEPSRRGGRTAAEVESLFVRGMPWWKRGVDICGAVVGLTLASPIMLGVAVASKIISPGPVLFRQKRTGLGGRVFTIYKFRTMVLNAEAQRQALEVVNERDGPAFKLTHDPRVTPFGHFLRKTGLDELPQLWNVLIGDMSLVGPRPLPCAEQERCRGWQQRRLEVAPGLTCFWQVQKGRKVPFDEWMRMDMRYVAGRSLLRDLALVCRTVVVVIAGRGDQ